MCSPQKNGKYFDTHVNNILKETCEQIVLDEIEISKKYGAQFRAIDTMIITHNGYMIFLQYKLHKSSISPRDIIYFYSQCETLSKEEKKPYICIYVSYEGITDNSVKWIEEHKKDNLYLYDFISINNKNENTLIREIVKYLYSKEIFLYEDDETVIMQNTEHEFFRYCIKV